MNVLAISKQHLYMENVTAYDSNYQYWLNRESVTATKEATEPGVSSARQFYGRHHDLINHYGISYSQITNDILYLSKSKYHPSVLFHDLSSD